MAIPKIMGTETEYGTRLHMPGTDTAQYPERISELVIQYAADAMGGKGVCWETDFEGGMADFFSEQNPCEQSDRRRRRNYAEESPVRKFLSSVERRNWHYDVFLPNGARAYPDHAHPEYSTPECRTVRALVAQEKAGERIFEAARKKMMEAYRAIGQENGLELIIYKMNNDYKGHSFGAHENYLLDRTARSILEVMYEVLPHFISRIIYCGSGDVKGSRKLHYEISQRAVFFENVSGIQTTHDRPIFNTRDEPHADPSKYIRLHVICGDANMSEYSIFLKMGTTGIVLQMIEDKKIDPSVVFPKDPVGTFHAISQDLSLDKKYVLENGKKITAINMQEYYLEHAQKYVEVCGTPEQQEVVKEWAFVLDALKKDPKETLWRHIDWVTKYRMLLNHMSNNKNLSWNDPRLQSFVMRYHETRPEGMYNRLRAKKGVICVVQEEDILRALCTPPEDTRAYFRAEVMKKFGHAIDSVNWEGVIGRNGNELLFNPEKGTKEDVGEALQKATTFDEVYKSIKAEQ